MKSLSCKEVGGMECDFTATGETNDEVKKKLHEHAAEVHKDKLEGMSDEDKQKIGAKMDELLSKQEWLCQQ